MTPPLTPLTYTVEQAAERLGPAVTKDWIKHHIAELPHTRSGKGRGRAGRVAFTEAHLMEILLLIEHRPATSPIPSQPDEFRTIVTRGRRTA